MIKYLPSKKMILLAALFLLTSGIPVSGYSFDQLEKPVFHVGDYWEYDVTNEIASNVGTISLQGTGRIEILSQTTLTIDGDTYEVWKFARTTETTSATINLSVTTYTISYRRTSDLATVQEFTDTEITRTTGTETSNEETTYIALQPTFDYPISVDDSWERHMEKEVRNESGTFIETEDAYYECTGTTEVTTEAGSFSCYVVRMDEDEPQGDTYTIDYHSDEVGNTVKRVQYEDGEQTMAMILTSYNYRGQTPPQNQRPTCSLTANPTSGTVPLTVTFTLSASDPDGSITTWALDINNDGTPEYNDSGTPPATQQHIYGTTGTHTAKLTVTDNKSATDSDTQIITVTSPPNQPPLTNFTYSRDELLVTFTDASTDPDGNITSWHWDFGDQNSSSESSPSHEYQEEGNYTVTLTVTDDDNETSNVTQIIKVEKDDGGGIPGFEMIALLASIGLLAMFKRKRK